MISKIGLYVRTKLFVRKSQTKDKSEIRRKLMNCITILIAVVRIYMNLQASLTFCNNLFSSISVVWTSYTNFTPLIKTKPYTDIFTK